MKTTTLLAVVMAALLPLAATASKLDNSTHYEITIPADDHRSALVSTSLVPDGPVFYMFPGANQFPRRWAAFVTDVEVHDEKGQAVPVEAQDDGSWRLSRIPGGRVTLSYRVNLDHEEHDWSGGIDGAAYKRDWGVFYTARSLFVVNGDDREGITVSFRLPDDWQVTTPWQEADGDTSRFVVPDHDVLATSMFFAGTHKEVPVRHGPFEFLLALGGEDVLAQEDVFVDMSRGILAYYVNLMGDVPRLQSRDSLGKPVVIINQAEVTDG